ncbi:MAG: hypothetical protein AAGK05_16895, partial [Pseudomonadota bacterium]
GKIRLPAPNYMAKVMKPKAAILRALNIVIPLMFRLEETERNGRSMWCSRQLLLKLTESLDIACQL